MRKTLSILMVLMLIPAVAAAVPGTITFQGYLTDSSGVPVTGSKDMVFSLYTVSSGGAAVWTETHSAVSIDKGVYTVELGSTTALTDTILSNTALYLGIKISTETAEMTPRQKVTAVAYSLRAKTAETAETALTSQNLACTGCVNATDIASGAVTAAKLATGSVTDVKIAAGISGTKVSGDIAGNAANVTGIVDIANGGTGATTAAGARTSLGVVARAGDSMTGRLIVSSAIAGNGAIQGQNNDPAGWGLFGSSSGSTGQGVHGSTFGSSGIGVFGEALNTGLSVSHGLYGKSDSLLGRGVTGIAFNTGAYNNVGGYFETMGTSNASYGIQAKAPSTGYAGYFEGSIKVNSSAGSDLTIAEDALSRTGNFTIDAINAAGDSTVTVMNSNAAYQANLNVDGTVMAEGFAYPAPKRLYYQLHPAAFQRREDASTARWSVWTDRAYFTAGTAPATVYLYAPVNLPQGSVIGEFRCDYFDNDGAANMDITIFLVRRILTSGLVETIGYTTWYGTLNSTAWQVLSDTSLISNVVDNANYSYVVYVTITQYVAIGTTLNAFGGCRIAYDLTGLNP